VSAPEVSVVVPVYCNASTLPELAERVDRSLSRRSYELVLVDDASPDGSRAAIDALARRDERVRAVRLDRNLGQHRAAMAGLARASGDWTVVMDADLQDPPEAIPSLLEAGQRGYSAVFAGRRGRYESRGRLLSSRVFKRTLALLTGLPPDAGMFLALDEGMRARLLAMRSNRPFLVAMVSCAGLPATSVPVARAPRAGGDSAYRGIGRVRSAARGLAWGLRAATTRLR
jgi:glycosyltransferase involved in cell wall biosynthesis